MNSIVFQRDVCSADSQNFVRLSVAAFNDGRVLLNTASPAFSAGTHIGINDLRAYAALLTDAVAFMDEYADGVNTELAA